MGVSKKQVQKMFLFSFLHPAPFFSQQQQQQQHQWRKIEETRLVLSRCPFSLSLSRCARARLESLLIKRPGVGGSIGWGWGKKSDFSMDFSVGGSRFFFNQRRILF